LRKSSSAVRNIQPFITPQSTDESAFCNQPSALPHVSHSRMAGVLLATAMERMNELVRRAQTGELAAYSLLVEATQAMVTGVALGVLRDHALAEDAAQETYLRAFRALGDLDEPAAFPGWLRRIAMTTALNLRRARRRTFLQLEEADDLPVLDETETVWSDRQRERLAGALLSLSVEERRLCDRRYHGGWSTARLARDAGVTELVMRKRLQRVRDKLRKEIEVSERRSLRPEDLPPDLPARIVELLARPNLSDLPENPVGQVLHLLRGVYADAAEVTLPEIVNFAEASASIGNDLLYVDAAELQRVDDERILRYDLTLPLMLAIRYEGVPLRLWTAGKVYRQSPKDSTHLDAFHQSEVFWMDERSRLDAWQLTARIVQSMHVLLPGRAMKIVPTEYPMCTEAWQLEIEDRGRWVELLAWGVFTDRLVRHLGGDPAVHTALGVGHGLERLAMLRYGIDDIRKIDVSRVA
jgi:RNA polymerase sigma-70 factor, ECF subfamily